MTRNRQMMMMMRIYLECKDKSGPRLSQHLTGCVYTHVLCANAWRCQYSGLSPCLQYSRMSLCLQCIGMSS